MSKIDFTIREAIYICIFVFFSILFLSYDDPWENIFLVVSILSFCFLVKDKTIFRKSGVVISIFLLCVLIYFTTIFFLFVQGYQMDVEKQYSNNQNDNVAVLLVYQGENPMYDLSIEVRNYSLQENVFGKLKIPFLLNKVKNNYKSIGKSDYKRNTEKIKHKLEQLLPENSMVYLGYLYDQKYIEEKLIDIVNDGYHKIIVTPVFLTDGKYLNSVKTRIDKMKLFNNNIHIRYTEPLWDSEIIVKCYLEKLYSNIDEKRILDIGIILIGEGEKDYENNNYITSIKQNIMFRKKVKSYLVDNLKFQEDNIRLAWSDFNEPNYTQEIKYLLEYGVGEIVCIYIKPQITYIETNVIVKEIESQIEFPEGVKVRIIDGFLDSKDFIFELKNKIQVEMLKKWE